MTLKIQPILLIDVRDLRKKSILYFATLKDSRFYNGTLDKTCQKVKDLCGYKYANAITRLSIHESQFKFTLWFYTNHEGSPYIKFTIWGADGIIYELKKSIKSRHERFTWDEVKEIQKITEKESYRRMVK